MRRSGSLQQNRGPSGRELNNYELSAVCIGSLVIYSHSSGFLIIGEGLDHFLPHTPLDFLPLGHILGRLLVFLGHIQRTGSCHLRETDHTFPVYPNNSPPKFPLPGPSRRRARAPLLQNHRSVSPLSFILSTREPLASLGRRKEDD